VRVPVNPMKSLPRRHGSIREDVLAALALLDKNGLQTCDDCAANPLCDGGREASNPLFGGWPCQHRAVERRLACPVDPANPDDLAIGIALQLEGEQDAYEGIDRTEKIIEASTARRISGQKRNELLAVEYQEQQRRLQASIEELRLAHERTPGPVPSDEELERQAEKRLETQDRRQRGTLARHRRYSKSDRRRLPTFEKQPFHKQLGRLATERDPHEIRRLVAELRRQASQHAFPPIDAQ
jgi:hypothetical protein